MIPDQLKSAAWEASLAHKVPQNLIIAISLVESNGNPYKIRYEPGWRGFVTPDLYAKALNITENTERVAQSISWGPTQIMGAVARELHFTDDLTKLCDYRLGTFWGAKNLSLLMHKYAKMEDVIAAYNAGFPRVDSQTGKYVNQNYVDRVLSKMNG